MLGETINTAAACLVSNSQTIRYYCGEQLSSLHPRRVGGTRAQSVFNCLLIVESSVEVLSLGMASPALRLNVRNVEEIEI